VFGELRRRNAFRVATLYVVTSWLILQVASTLFEVLHIPEWASRLVLALLVLGFPIALLFSWIYELTPEGLKKQHEVDRTQSITYVTGRRIDYAIGALAVLAIVVVIVDRFVPRDSTSEKQAPPLDATVSSTKSIAVLPFLDMSQAKDQEYFADGITEELLNLLARNPGIKVIGRTSSFQFKGKNEDLRVIGEKLGVNHLLEGSVRKAGDKVRITAQLIRAGDGSHVWSETYDRELNDVFAVQDDIAGEVVRALKVTLLGPPAAPRTLDPETHALFLQGQFFLSRKSPDDMQRSIDYFEQALARDPTFAPAWVGVGAASFNLTNSIERDKWFAKARAAAQKAIELAPESGDGYASLAMAIAAQDWNWSEVGRLVARARELDPRGQRTLSASASFAWFTGDNAGAIDAFRQITEIDPLSTTAWHNYAHVLKNAARYDEAERAARKALELNPGQVSGYATLALIQALRGDGAAALASAVEEPDEFWKAATMPIALFAAGKPDEAAAALSTLREKYSDTAAYQIAMCYAFLGKRDDALDWLERALAQRDDGLTEVLNEPTFASLRDAPRYREVVRKVGFQPI
jgi:TolB-like protein/tetratricopeptide (TPR) repeat protein